MVRLAKVRVSLKSGVHNLEQLTGLQDDPPTDQALGAILVVVHTL